MTRIQIFQDEREGWIDLDERKFYFPHDGVLFYEIETALDETAKRTEPISIDYDTHPGEVEVPISDDELIDNLQEIFDRHRVETDVSKSSRRYVDDPSEAPGDVQVHEGDRGGHYYYPSELEGTGESDGSSDIGYDELGDKELANRASEIAGRDIEIWDEDDRKRAKFLIWRDKQGPLDETLIDLEVEGDISSTVSEQVAPAIESLDVSHGTLNPNDDYWMGVHTVTTNPVVEKPGNAAGVAYKGEGAVYMNPDALQQEYWDNRGTEDAPWDVSDKVGTPEEKATLALYHELLHFKMLEWDIDKSFEEEEKEVVHRELGSLASSEPGEMIPEVGAMLLAGIDVPDDVMEIYYRYGGEEV